jgi:hypothetical protein
MCEFTHSLASLGMSPLEVVLTVFCEVSPAIKQRQREFVLLSPWHCVEDALGSIARRGPGVVGMPPDSASDRDYDDWIEIVPLNVLR